MVPSLMFGQKFIGKVTPAAASSGETAFFLGDLLVAEDVGVFAAITTLSLGTIVSVEEVSKEQTAFKISPNPTTHQITISSQDPIDTVRIFDGNGREGFKGSGSLLDVAHLISGTYLVQLNDTNAIIFIKQ